MKCVCVCLSLTGRKLKRFGVLKAMGLGTSLMFQGHTLASMSCVPGIQELQFSPQFINILENIEPEMVYSGFDNSQAELPHLLLNSLNRLCERQLLWIVRWSKALPGLATSVSTQRHTLFLITVHRRALHWHDTSLWWLCDEGRWGLWFVVKERTMSRPEGKSKLMCGTKLKADQIPYMKPVGDNSGSDWWWRWTVGERHTRWITTLAYHFLAEEATRSVIKMDFNVQLAMNNTESDTDII